MCRRIVSSRAPSLHGHYPISSLLRARPPPFHLQPISRWNGYTAYLLPKISLRGEDGFSSCFRMSLSPCCFCYPAEVVRSFIQHLIHTILPSPDTIRLGLRDYFLSRQLVNSLSLRPGDSLTLPRRAWSIGFSAFDFSPACDSSYGVASFFPGGFDSR